MKRMKNEINWLLLCLLVFAMVFLQAFPARSQISSEIEASLGLAIERNDNIGLDSGEEEEIEEDTITSVKPAVSASWEGSGNSLSLSYSGEYQDYLDGTRDAEWFHTLDAQLDWRSLAPFILTASERREVISRDLDRPEEEVGNLLHRNIVSIRPSLLWPIDRTFDFELAYEGEWQTFPGEDETDERTSHLGQLRLNKRWSPLWENTMTAGGGRVYRTESEDFDILEADLGFIHHLSRYLDLEYGLSWERRRYEEDDDQFWLGRASLSRRLANGGQLAASLMDSLEDRYDGETLRTVRGEAEFLWIFARGSTLRALWFYEDREYQVADSREFAQGPRADIRLVLNEWFALNFGLGWTKTRLEDEGEEGEDIDDKLARASAAIVYTSGRYFNLEAGYAYLNNDSTDESRSYENNRQWVVLTGHF